MTPLTSLETGQWFKLICGASYQDLPAVRSLALAYTLAGADCIDVAADPAVIAAARVGIAAAEKLTPEARGRGFMPATPFLMASLNDGEDPHFRKASFDPTTCPADCPRPCLNICPAAAIAPAGIVAERCYGCGRCLPLCPHDNIQAHTHQLPAAAILALLTDTKIEAIEIHTQPGRTAEFARLWGSIAPLFARENSLHLLAVSCPDGTGLIDYQQTLYYLIREHWPGPLVWQTDGRPMSGDIGIGATRASIKLARKVAVAGPPGYVQLAGGTNQHTVPKLRSQGLLATHTGRSASRTVAGVAYGSYARTQLAPLLARLPATGNAPDGPVSALETSPDLLWSAVAIAASLVAQIKLAQSERSQLSSLPRTID